MFKPLSNFKESVQMFQLEKIAAFKKNRGDHLHFYIFGMIVINYIDLLVKCCTVCLRRLYFQK